MQPSLSAFDTRPRFESAVTPLLIPNPPPTPATSLLPHERRLATTTMSAVQDTTTAAQPAEAVVERVMTNPTPVVPAEETVPATTEAAPIATATTTDAAKPEETVAAPVTAEEKAEENAVPVTEAKIAEPITEGQLGYKAPGLLK